MSTKNGPARGASSTSKTKADPKKAKAKSGTKGKTKAKPKSPRCKQCGKVIRVPPGWSRGPAVRRHYWREHREVMLGERGKSS